VSQEARRQVYSGEIAQHPYLEQAEHLLAESRKHLTAYLAAVSFAEAK
jgi:hypothetical protein